jgi:hypothetical protein
MIPDAFQIISAALDTLYATTINVRQDRGLIMITSIVDSDRLPGRLKTAAGNNASNQEGSVNSRRYMDAINTGRTLNLDRRGMYGERRIGLAAQCKGPARRKIIARRETPSDRRE